MIAKQRRINQILVYIMYAKSKKNHALNKEKNDSELKSHDNNRFVQDVYAIHHKIGNQGFKKVIQKKIKYFESVVETFSNNGKAIDQKTRTLMESRFGYDFSHVRLHTGREAEESSQSMNARAYTSGRHIVMGKAYNAGSSWGNKLLAHELAHVIQQSRGGVAPAGNPRAAHERDAEKAENTFAANSAPIGVECKTAVGIATKPDGASNEAVGTLPAMTPEDMYNKITARRAFEQHVPVHQLTEVAAQLRQMESELQKNPTPQLKRAYSNLLERYNLSRLEGPGAAAGPGYSTYVLIQVLDKNGKRVAAAFGKYTSGKHAEELSLLDLGAQIGNRKVTGGRIEVVGDKEICAKICMPAIESFAKKHGITRLDGHVFQRSKLIGEGMASEKTTARTVTKRSSAGKKLTRRTKTVVHGQQKVREPAVAPKIAVKPGPRAKTPGRQRSPKRGARRPPRLQPKRTTVTKRFGARRPVMGETPMGGALGGAIFMLHSEQVAYLHRAVFVNAERALAKKMNYIEAERLGGKWVVVQMVVDEPKAIDVLGAAIGIAEPGQIPFFVDLVLYSGNSESEALNPPATISAAPPMKLGEHSEPVLKGPKEGRAWRTYHYATYEPYAEMAQPAGLMAYGISPFRSDEYKYLMAGTYESKQTDRLLIIRFLADDLEVVCWNRIDGDTYAVDILRWEHGIGMLEIELVSQSTGEKIRSKIFYKNYNELVEQFVKELSPKRGIIEWKRVG